MNKKKTLKALLTVLFVIFLIYKVDFQTTILELRKSNLILVLIAFLIYLFYNFLAILRFKLSFSVFSKEEVSYYNLARVHFIALFYNFFLPSSVGGDLSKLVYLPGEVQRKRKLLIILFDRVIGLFALLGLTIIALIMNPKISLEIQSNRLLYLALFLLLSLFIVLKFKDKFLIIKEKFKKINKSKLFLIFLLSVFLQILVIFIHLLVADSLNFNLTFINHLAVVGLVNFLTLLPITISGYGLREVGYISLYSLFQIDSDLVLAKILIIYLFNLFLAFLGWYLVLIGRKNSNEKE